MITYISIEYNEVLLKDFKNVLEEEIAIEKLEIVIVFQILEAPMVLESLDIGEIAVTIWFIDKKFCQIVCDLSISKLRGDDE